MSSCCCHCCCHCCGCGCDSSCPDQELGGVSLTEFPVYVSYPAFFAGDEAISGANQAIFSTNGIMPLSGLTAGVSRSAVRTRSCQG